MQATEAGGSAGGAGEPLGPAGGGQGYGVSWGDVGGCMGSRQRLLGGCGGCRRIMGCIGASGSWGSGRGRRDHGGPRRCVGAWARGGYVGGLAGTPGAWGSVGGRGAVVRGRTEHAEGPGMLHTQLPRDTV